MNLATDLHRHGANDTKRYGRKANTMGHSPEKGALMHSHDDESLLDAALRNCSCYKQGHNLHWIAVLKKWADEPRIPASIFVAPNGAFLVTSEHGLKVAYCHTPGRLASLISQHGSVGWHLVADTGAMTAPKQENGSRTWAFLSDQPVNDCEKNACECYDPDEIWDED
jgi:hypothetical protein